MGRAGGRWAADRGCEADLRRLLARRGPDRGGPYAAFPRQPDAGRRPQLTTYRDQAVILRKLDYGEADRIYTLLTREHGN